MPLYTGKLKPWKNRSTEHAPAHSGQAGGASPRASQADGRPWRLDPPWIQRSTVKTRTAPPRRLVARLSAPVHVRVPSAQESAHNEPVRRQAAYLRVSTAQQNEALQREAIERAAAARGENIDFWVTEKASGKRVDRPELESLRVLARRGELSTLWVFRLDRLARSAVFLVTVVEELKNSGCRVVTPDGLDTQGPWAPAIMVVLGTAAEIELEAQRGAWPPPAPRPRPPENAGAGPEGRPRTATTSW